MSTPVTLDNCDIEPIHVPGLIQTHGALLAFDLQQRLAFVSDNAAYHLALRVTPGASLDEQNFPPVLADHIRAWYADPAKTFVAFDVAWCEKAFDIVGHRNDQDLLIVEFESVNPDDIANDTSFAMMVHRAMERFKRQSNVDDLLGMVATEVRDFTGFDRVMAYRFLSDESGEVIRESRRTDLEDWEGHRYPSSDIPAQARRLYIANTLRLIANVQAPSVSVSPSAHMGEAPLDMSYCVLRSVSPMHIEYLSNLGVAASMSISIVIDGKLWGMIACHHGAPRHVPHRVRMICEVVGQAIAITIASLQTRILAEKLLKATTALAAIGVRVRAADDLLTGLSQGSPNPADLIASDATVCLWGGQSAFCSGDFPAEKVTPLAESLDRLDQELFTSHRQADMSPELASAIAPYVGIQAVCFDVGQRGWVVWLRTEQIENVRWAGKPEKTLKVGPNGARLTPRGSFLEWREEVRGTSLPWESADVRTAETLRAELSRIAGAYAIEMEKARHQLLAALGHDLREPLQLIALAAQLCRYGGWKTSASELLLRPAE